MRKTVGLSTQHQMTTGQSASFSRLTSTTWWFEIHGTWVWPDISEIWRRHAVLKETCSATGCNIYARQSWFVGYEKIHFLKQAGQWVLIQCPALRACAWDANLVRFDPGHLASSRGEPEIFDIRNTIPRSFCVGTIPAPQHADRSDG